MARTKSQTSKKRQQAKLEDSRGGQKTKKKENVPVRKPSDPARRSRSEPDRPLHSKTTARKSEKQQQPKPKVLRKRPENFADTPATARLRPTSHQQQKSGGTQQSESSPAELPDHPALTQKKQTTNKTAKRGPARRYRPGMKALMEIKKYQKTTEMLIPKLSFSRVIREVLQGFTGRDLRVTAETLLCLQEASEAYLVMFFEDAMLLATHAKRTTLMAGDISLLKRLRGRSDPCNP